MNILERMNGLMRVKNNNDKKLHIDTLRLNMITRGYYSIYRSSEAPSSKK